MMKIRTACMRTLFFTCLMTASVVAASANTTLSLEKSDEVNASSRSAMELPVMTVSDFEESFQDRLSHDFSLASLSGDSGSTPEKRMIPAPPSGLRTSITRKPLPPVLSARNESHVEASAWKLRPEPIAILMISLIGAPLIARTARRRFQTAQPDAV